MSDKMRKLGKLHTALALLIVINVIYRIFPAVDAFGFLSDEWLPLTESEALDYYTSFEVCRLVRGHECEVEPGYEFGHFIEPCQ